jgi:hypothetical protein
MAEKVTVLVTLVDAPVPPSTPEPPKLDVSPPELTDMQPAVTSSGAMARRRIEPSSPNIGDPPEPCV